MASPRQNAPAPAGALDPLNDPGEVFKNTSQVEFIRTLVRLLAEAFSRVVFRDQAAPHVHLISPSGKVYKLSVTDAGAMSVSYVRG
jgi:hypothetical protein